MTSTDFFVGTRKVGEGTIQLRGGKTDLYWQVREYWDELASCPLKCGGEYSKAISRRSGIKRTDKEELEAAAKADLKVIGIAGLSTELTGRLGYEITFEVEEGEVDTLRWKAPDRGALTVLLYQLTQRITLHYRDRRLLGLESWTKHITRRLNRYHDGSRRFDSHPDCGGGDPGNGGKGLIYADGQPVSFIMVYQLTEEGVQFPSHGFETPSTIQEVIGSVVRFAYEDLPPAIQFLLGPDRSDIRATLRPYTEQWLGETPADPAAETIQLKFMSIADMELGRAPESDDTAIRAAYRTMDQ